MRGVGRWKADLRVLPDNHDLCKATPQRVKLGWCIAEQMYSLVISTEPDNAHDDHCSATKGVKDGHNQVH